VLNKTDLITDRNQIAGRALAYNAIPVCATDARTLNPFLHELDDMLDCICNETGPSAPAAAAGAEDSFG